VVDCVGTSVEAEESRVISVGFCDCVTALGFGVEFPAGQKEGIGGYMPAYRVLSDEGSAVGVGGAQVWGGGPWRVIAKDLLLKQPGTDVVALDRVDSASCQLVSLGEAKQEDRLPELSNAASGSFFITFDNLID
jgi:hypothetical protein